MPPKLGFAPPANWSVMLDRLRAIRRSLTAPVDTIGCDKLFDPCATKEDQRFQTLVSLMLSAQTRDQCTAEAMGRLHAAKLCTASTLSRTPAAKVAKLIDCVGFYQRKADFVTRTAALLLEKHGGCVPNTVEALVSLPGVGPKMAHLFMQCADGVNSGIGVDVHVHRIAQRWRWVPPNTNTPEQTRVSLEAWLPKEHWRDINWLLVGFGQVVCRPRWPKCLTCGMRDVCPQAFAEESKPQQLHREKVLGLSKTQARSLDTTATSSPLLDIEDLVPPGEGMRQGGHAKGGNAGRLTRATSSVPRGRYTWKAPPDGRGETAHRSDSPAKNVVVEPTTNGIAFMDSLRAPHAATARRPVAKTVTSGKKIVVGQKRVRAASV